MPEQSRSHFSASGKRKILVVEDELINREMLGMMLQDQYEVIFAETGKAAVSHIDSGADTMSLVLLDLNLPDMKGLDVLRYLKSNARTAMLPVIVMTADQEAEVECLTLGAIDFIPKPYPQPRVVLARILRTIELSEDRDIIRWTERDQLTGLYNREYFFRYASQLDLHNKDTAMDAVIMDVNHFHLLNERYGRAAGDEILKKIAEKILEALEGGNGIACRREADTFLIYCPHRTDYESLLESASVEIAEENRIRLRMGIYSEADKGIDLEHRFDRAKLAADTLRGSFTKSVAIYDNSLHEEEVFAEQLLESFRTAIREKQFLVVYQPKFDVRPDKAALNSAEALVRWRHPDLGMISPGVFIPLFEKNGMIGELDAYVWREAASQIREWKKSLGRSIPVSINISRIDLYDPQLPEVLVGLMEEFELNKGELLLEITESAYTENPEQIISVVKDLRDRGFLIEMDDFGTGYSSLNMLSTLPIDALKLDMQFIRNAFRERKDIRLLEAVISLAKSLEFPTIAEGVETAEQMFTLKSMGCDIVQGYFFSRPLAPADFEEYVRGLSHFGQDTEGAQARQGRRGPKDRYTYEAMHDPLTGLYNHSAFDILFCDADQDHIAVALAHVDGYGKILKERGKNCADQVILQIAGILRKSFRSVDIICRLQEAEFVVIVSRVTSSLKEQIFEKISQINESLQEVGDGEIPVSMSFGIAFSDRENPQGDVFRDAETALHRVEQMKQNHFAVY